MIILNVGIALCFMFLPTIICSAKANNETVVMVFLLNLCVGLVSFVIPIAGGFVGISTIFLFSLSYIILFAYAEDMADKEFENRLLGLKKAV